MYMQLLNRSAVVLPLYILMRLCNLCYSFYRTYQEGTSGPRRKRSRSVGHLSSGHINPPFVHEYKDGLEMGWSLNTGEVFRHESEAQGLSSRQTVDDSGFSYRYQTASGYRSEVSYSNGAPKRNDQDKFYHGSLDTYF